MVTIPPNSSQTPTPSNKKKTFLKPKSLKPILIHYQPKFKMVKMEIKSANYLTNPCLSFDFDNYKTHQTLNSLTPNKKIKKKQNFNKKLYRTQTTKGLKKMQSRICM